MYMLNFLDTFSMSVTEEATNEKLVI